MAVPKKKTSKQRKNKRRTHYKITAPTTISCQNCGATVRYHRVCSECGHYKGNLVIEKDVAV
jgi:large subunit ribosomal protein L32